MLNASPSQISEVNKHLRLQRLISARMEALKNSGLPLQTWKNDYEKLEELRLLLKNALKQSDPEHHYRAIYKNFKNEHGLTQKDHLERLGYEKEKYYNNGGNFINEFMLLLQKQARESRAESWSWRLKQEFALAVKANHFMVFNTLTINPEHKDEFWAKGSQNFKNYIHKCNRLLLNHRYFAVTESGKRGREHFHVIHFFERPKHLFADPNYGRRIPKYMEIDEIKRLWQFGYSSPEMIRTGAGDAWARAGYRWQVDKVNHQPIKASNTDALSGYLGKYITKTLTETKHTSWRIKATRTLGLTAIRKTLTKLNNRKLAKLLNTTSTDQVKINGHKIPTRILKKQALKLLNARLSNRKSYRKLITTRICKSPLLSQLKSLTTEIRNSSQANAGKSNNQQEGFISSLYPQYSDEGTVEAIDALKRLIPKQKIKQPMLTAAGSTEI